MSSKKLLTLLLISFVATSVVVIQLRNRRPVRPPVSIPSTEPPGRGAVDTPPAAPPESEIPAPDASLTQINIPASGWGRNPFLSLEEINAINAPPPLAPVVQQTPSPVRVEPTTGLPIYAVTAILIGPQGKWAVIDSRVLQEGDRIGQETLREIKAESVILEHEGRPRELVLKSFADALRKSSPPKGDKS